ncbi:hypothetical protein L3Y34_016069 [Caenorhabditis briggsae]|uniref:Uncharacterized protein n=1 Tax=Caenorhabditis briggsae TaxID=6238 RepID=A0AAE9J0L5_CAEBR|nr:hypothetical protein L3Y34_016069 [Caenorhabditis briggsae]
MTLYRNKTKAIKDDYVKAVMFMHMSILQLSWAVRCSRQSISFKQISSTTLQQAGEDLDGVRRALEAYAAHMGHSRKIQDQCYGVDFELPKLQGGLDEFNNNFTSILSLETESRSVSSNYFVNFVKL